jgi:hypothetical protein
MDSNIVYVGRYACALCVCVCASPRVVGAGRIMI